MLSVVLPRFWLFLFLVFFIVSLAVFVFVQGIDIVVNMKLSEGFDMGYATCVYGDVLYVVGSTNRSAFAMGFSLLNKSKLFSWVSSWHGELYDCIVVGSNIYVVGVKGFGEDSRWFVGVFNASLGLISWRESYVRAAALSIDYSNGFLYVSGFAKVGTVDGSDDVGWVIEKIDVHNISNYITVTSNPSSGGDVASAIKVNPLDGSVWVAGLNAENRMWRIEVYDSDLKLLKARDLDIPNYPWAIAFDADGYAYIAGSGVVAKLDRDLNVVAKASVGGNTAKLVLYNNTYVVVLSQHSNEQGVLGHFIYIFDKNLNLLYSRCATCNGIYRAYLDEGSVAVVNRSLFIAGYATTNMSRLSSTYLLVYRFAFPEQLQLATNVSRHSSSLNQLVLIIGVPIAVVAVLAALLFTVTRRRKAVKGGVKRKRVAKAYKIRRR